MAYTPRVNESFPSADWERLRELGFNLPSQPALSTVPRAVKRIMEDTNDDAVPKDYGWWQPSGGLEDVEDDGGSTSEEDIDGVVKAKLGDGVLGFGPPLKTTLVESESISLMDMVWRRRGDGYLRTDLPW